MKGNRYQWLKTTATGPEYTTPNKVLSAEYTFFYVVYNDNSKRKSVMNKKKKPFNKLYCVYNISIQLEVHRKLPFKSIPYNDERSR